MVDTTEEAEVVEEAPAVTGTGARASARYFRNIIIKPILFPAVHALLCKYIARRCTYFA